MFRFNKDLEYALISLVEMSKVSANQLTTARQLSQKFEIPFKLLARILQKLKNGGIIHSVKGSTGGYYLTLGAHEIQLGNVMRAVRGEEYIADCLNDEGYCPQDDCGCNIKPLVKNFQDKWVSFVESITLEEFAWAELADDSTEEQ